MVPMPKPYNPRDRFYEQAGLLRAPDRSVSGYRDYDDRAVARIGFIKAGQAIGLTLAEIRTLIRVRDDGRAPCAAATALLDDRISEVAQPRGPILATIPVTNPTSTTIFKALICMKTRNPVILLPASNATS